MPRGQWRALEHSASGGRPAPRSAQGQAHAKIQAQAEVPFGNLLAAGLIAGAVTGVIEERMAEAASRQTGPGVPTVPPAKDAIPDESRDDPTPGGPAPPDHGRAEGASSDAAALSPSTDPDRAGPDAASLKVPSELRADAADLPTLQNHVASTASVLPVASHATSDPAAESADPAPGDLTGRITDEIADTIGRVVVKLGQIAESGGLTGLDSGFGEALVHEIVGAATRIATDLTNTFSLSSTDTTALTEVANLPSQVLAEVTSTVDQTISAIDIPASLLGAEEDHVTPALLSRVFDYAESAQPSASHTPDLKQSGDTGDAATSHAAADVATTADVGSVSVSFAGQSYVDAQDAHDWAFGPVTNLLHGFV